MSVIRTLARQMRDHLLHGCVQVTAVLHQIAGDPRARCRHDESRKGRRRHGRARDSRRRRARRAESDNFAVLPSLPVPEMTMARGAGSSCAENQTRSLRSNQNTSGTGRAQGNCDVDFSERDPARHRRHDPAAACRIPSLAAPPNRPGRWRVREPGAAQWSVQRVACRIRTPRPRASQRSRILGGAPRRDMINVVLCRVKLLGLYSTTQIRFCRK